MRQASRVGEQLDLFDLEDFTETVYMPWGGRSPRELTAAYERSILKAQAKESMGEDGRPVQCDLWLSEEEGSPVFVYGGAPCLLPVRSRRLRRGYRA